MIFITFFGSMQTNPARNKVDCFQDFLHTFTVLENILQSRNRYTEKERQ